MLKISLLFSLLVLVASGRFRVRERADKTSSPIDLGELAKNFVIRRCMADYARRWPSQRNKWGFHFVTAAPSPHGADAEGKSIVEAVEELWELTDLIANRIADYNIFKTMFATKFSDKVANLTDLREQRISSLQGGTGLKYERLEAFCNTLGGDDPIDCLKESARKAGGFNLSALVEERKELEDFKALAFPRWEPFRLNIRYPGYNEHIEKHLDKAKLNIKKKSFSYSESLAQCRKNSQDDASTRIRVLKEDLLSATESWEVGNMSTWGKDCVETSDLYCGEGYSAARKLEFNSQASLATFAFMQPGSYALMCIALGLKAGIAAIPTGPASMAAAAILGCGVGIAIPGNTAIALGSGALVGMLTSRFDCGCFPRNCEYDENLQQCMIGGPLKSPSKNPYAQALPGQGLKCVPYTSSKVEKKFCRYESCTSDDYRETNNDYVKSMGLRGRIGRSEGGGLMNCLSKESNGGYMMLEAVLPETGKKNTPVNRTQMLRSLTVQPLPDCYYDEKRETCLIFNDPYERTFGQALREQGLKCILHKSSNATNGLSAKSCHYVRALRH